MKEWFWPTFRENEQDDPVASALRLHPCRWRASKGCRLAAQDWAFTESGPEPDTAQVSNLPQGQRCLQVTDITHIHKLHLPLALRHESALRRAARSPCSAG
jgi:hypothetical protein